MSLEVFNNIVSQYNQLNLDQSKITSNSFSKIDGIYKKCREIPESDRAALNSSESIELKEQFTKVEKQVHQLFLRSLMMGAGESSNTSYVDAIGTFTEDNRQYLARLYQGDDSATDKEILKFSKHVSHRFFVSLWNIIGRPASSDSKYPEQVGEFAFLNQHGYTSSAREKYEAIITSCDQNGAVFLSSLVGDVETLKEVYLLSQSRPIPKHVLDEVGLIPRYVLDVAGMQAIEKRHMDYVECLVSNGWEISNSLLLYAVQVSAGMGNLNSLKFLLSGERAIYSWDLSTTVILAAENGHADCVKFLLSKESETDPESLGSALVKAASQGYADCVKALVSDERQIARRYFENAVKEAASQGYEDCVKALLPEGKDIDKSLLGEAVYEAANNGHLKCLEHLLKGREIDEDDLKDAVQAAAQNGHLKCLEHLLPLGGGIDDNRFCDLAFNVAQRDHLECLQYLLAHQLSQGRQLTQQQLSHSLRNNFNRLPIRCLELLVPVGQRLDQDVFDRRVILESFRGNYDDVHFYLTRGQSLTVSARDSAITQAIGERRNEICDILRMADTIPDRVSLAPSRKAISLSNVEKDPVAFLEDLASNPLPNSFSLKEHPQVIDLGGVSKQVYFTLFSALREKSKLSLNSDGIPYTNNQKSIDIYKTLGKFYSLLIDTNKDRTDKFLTGIVFSPHFFKFVQAVIIDSTNTKALIEILRNIPSDDPKDHMIPYFKLIEDPENEGLIDAVKQLMVHELEEDPFDYAENKVLELSSEPNDDISLCQSLLENPQAEGLVEKVKQLMLKELGDPVSYAKDKVLNPTLNAAQAFIDGASPNLLEMLKTTSPDDFSCQVQGEPVSKETVLNSLNILTTADRPSTPAFVRHVEWLQEKIRSADAEWLEKFVFTITGASIFTAGKKLTIQPTLRDTGFEFESHTCFNSLDLPRNAMEKAAFLKALDGNLQDPEYNIQ